VSRSVEYVVVGGGAMGSAAAWQLAESGADVLLLERFEPGHVQGASHGASRNFNVSYDRAEYIDLLVEALPLWRRLESETAVEVLDLVGIVSHGGDGGEYERVRAALGAAGIPAEILTAADAGARWRGIRFATDVLYTPQAGRINADAAVRALQAAAIARGARVQHETRATRLDVVGDDHVRVTTESGTIDARRAIVTVGAWTTKLLGSHAPLPALVVTQEQPLHFGVSDPEAVWPGFNHRRGEHDDGWYASVYGMFTPGQGVKAGWHGVGPVTDPDARTFRSEPRQREALQRYARRWLPGVDPDAFTEISCTYTTTPDSDFILDRVGPVTVGAGFSGHGFKFTPAIGRVLADLAQGDVAAHPAFSLGRFTSRTASALA
jgi:sarcosine oxidase